MLFKGELNKVNLFITPSLISRNNVMFFRSNRLCLALYLNLLELYKLEYTFRPLHVSMQFRLYLHPVLRFTGASRFESLDPTHVVVELYS